MFKQGDIVINFYRMTVYRFDFGNETHRKDFYRCRLSTFQECEKFNALKKETAKLGEIGVKRLPGSFNTVEIKANINKGRLIDLHRFAENHNVKSYEEVFYYILRDANADKDKEILDLKKENKALRDKLKNIEKMLKF